MADMLPYKASGCGCAAARSYGCACGSGYGAPRFVPAQPRHYAAAQEGEPEKGGVSWLALALAAGGVWVLYKAYADLPVGTTPGSYSEYMDRKYRRPL